MPRVRLGVALLIPEPVATEIDGLRRALGDGALGRIPAHLTLVPPVNVAVDRLGEATDLLVAAAAGSSPLELALGPADTFWPVTPVVYLAVGGQAERVHALRDAVFREPLARRLTYEFVPHVTLADEVASPERMGAAVSALADYRRDVRIDRVHILQEGPGRVWTPMADAPLAAVAVVGRGGLPLALVRSGLPDPASLARLSRPAPLVVTARREGSVVGAAEARIMGDGSEAVLVELSVAEGSRRTGVGSALLAELGSALAELGVSRLVAPVLVHPDVAGFLTHRGFRDAGLAGLVRDL